MAGLLSGEPALGAPVGPAVPARREGRFPGARCGGNASAARPRAAATPRRAELALIANPGSHGNRRGRLDALRRAAAEAGVAAAEPDSRAALRRALSGFAASGARLLAVSGGDGTLREVLTALPEAWPGPAPAIALLPAGKTDLAAGDVGAAGRGADGLCRLLRALDAGAPLRRAERPVLEVLRPGAAEPRLRGFLFGAAAFAEGHRVANAEMHPGGLFGGLAVAATVAAVAARALRGTGPLAAGRPMALSVDGGPSTEGPRFVLLATTLDRLTLGLWPFSGRPDDRPDDGRNDPAPLHWLDVDAPPRQLGRALWRSWRPAGGAWRPRPGHRSGRAGHLAAGFRPGDRFVLDGESYEAGPNTVLLRAPERQLFVSP